MLNLFLTKYNLSNDFVIGQLSHKKWKIKNI